MGFKKIMKWHSNFKNIEKVILYKIDAFLLSFKPKSDTKLLAKFFEKLVRKLSQKQLSNQTFFVKIDSEGNFTRPQPPFILLSKHYEKYLDKHLF